jgi:hypothetical protein
MLTYADVCYFIQVGAISSFLRDKFADLFGEAVMRPKKKIITACSYNASVHILAAYGLID